MNEKAKFKIALKQYLTTHSFYFVDELLLPKKGMSFLKVCNISGLCLILHILILHLTLHIILILHLCLYF
jgi:hypothetical protein